MIAIVSAVNERGVDHVAIMGYSWGGGDTYLLTRHIANRLSDDFQRTFDIPFAAYIDAIAKPEDHPETNRPMFSLFHVNQYEANERAFDPDGAPSGADDIVYDYTSTLTHYSIDDDTVVLGTIALWLRRKVVR
jgi:hypothetical protein